MGEAGGVNNLKGGEGGSGNLPIRSTFALEGLATGGGATPHGDAPGQDAPDKRCT